jgi:hypothetical protein
MALYSYARVSPTSKTCAPTEPLRHDEKLGSVDIARRLGIGGASVDRVVAKRAA